MFPRALAVGAGLALAGSAMGTIITFDTTAGGSPLNPPDLFADTTALREEYSTLGVHFLGPAALDGGAIVDRVGGNWFVPEKSGVGILGFASDADLSGGGKANWPQTIVFDAPMTQVSIWVVSSDAGSAVLNAYDGSDNFIQAVGFGVTFSEWKQLVVSGAGIRKVVLSFSGGSVFAGEDLEFVPAPGSVALVGAAGWILVRRSRS